ncbi:hypothetical protein CYMTET_47953 [Cymbomonas tetramitiformis]|uniref:Uncharacterized protein n=1 Tax=Cymbomonas tetramitiformis TaxID=36881 RepID=A0AAE0EW36_9CHLO|nr:hypothetical protein CYMTET_47953 [Cymbomonas tetramitiformis]
MYRRAEDHEDAVRICVPRQSNRPPFGLAEPTNVLFSVQEFFGYVQEISDLHEPGFKEHTWEDIFSDPFDLADDPGTVHFRQHKWLLEPPIGVNLQGMVLKIRDAIASGEPYHRPPELVVSDGDRRMKPQRLSPSPPAPMDKVVDMTYTEVHEPEDPPPEMPTRRDEGYSKNMLEDLIGQLTVITRELTSELVDCKDVPKLQNLVDEFFKSLERDGSPDWLVINTHLLSHFPDQLLMYGPIRGTWMYVFESFNGKIRRWVKNNAYPVQSVMQGFGRYRMVHVVRGLILVLRRRREATTNPTRPPVLRFLTTAPLRAPNTVVLGTQGKRHVLSRAETKALELWMHGNVPQYRKLKAKFDDYVTYCKRSGWGDHSRRMKRHSSKGLLACVNLSARSWFEEFAIARQLKTRRRKLVNVTSEPFSLEKHQRPEEIETDRYAMVDSIYKVDLAAKEYILVKGKWFPEFNQATTKRFAKLNSKYGPDNTAKVVYTYDPDDPETPWDTTDPFILAAQIEHQVVIKKHPVMKTAVVFDLKADFFECIDDDGSRPKEDIRNIFRVSSGKTALCMSSGKMSSEIRKTFRTSSARLPRRVSSGFQKTFHSEDVFWKPEDIISTKTSIRRSEDVF